MFDFLWDLHQQRRISSLETTSGRAASDASDARRTAAATEERLDAMTLAMMAMWSIMQERLGVTDKDLVNRMQELDLRDGKLDGKVSGTASTCRACKRVMTPRNKRCIYCGGESLQTGPFAGL